MNENELRRVVEDVVRALAGKGYLKEPAGDRRCDGAQLSTVGSAGKVFASPEWTARKPPAPPRESCDECRGDACGRCAAASGAGAAALKALGADRVAVCRPTDRCAAVAGMVDHTLLKPNATQAEVAKLCEEARTYRFASVCINPAYVAYAARLLSGSGVKVCTVIGFPLGSTT
ncbi:MAG: hypothetical protein PHF00_13795, partial [Elusimicrobia bacterium]|nr:hypothetical protein [Elusimicrobiota bacterium]